ncbi:MAG: molecular chaperone DnaJ [Acidimicrobiia bacterium]|nr:molecular chaperone DnaJ [Acidimicrobiia bacterium]
MAKDYYQILGVAPDAQSAEIKSAFRRIARESHPDANPDDPGAAARFREAAEAYEVLSHPEKRAKYDRGDSIDLSDLFQGMGGFEDILRSVFGEGGLFGGGGARPSRGRDVLVRTGITLEQAAFGCDVDVEYTSRAECTVCSGSGAKHQRSIRTCQTCGGAGAVRMARRSFIGTMMSVTDCPDCRGQGTVISDPCDSCAGLGVVTGQRTVTVEIPPGVSTGTRLRLNGRGEAVGRGGKPGDLHVELVVADDPRFERRDIDLIHRVQIDIVGASLGTRIKVPLLDGGATDLEIPPGTQPGSTFTIEGYGIPRLGHRGRGDLIVVASVQVPSSLSEEESGLLREFGRLRDEGRPPDSG